RKEDFHRGNPFFQIRIGPCKLPQQTGAQMKLDDRSAAQDAGRIQNTRWSAILLSAQSQEHGLRAPLADWPRLYWHPLYAFVRRRGYNAVALTPDGRRVVWVSAAGALGIWDL